MSDNNITAALIEDDHRNMKRRHLIYNIAVLKVDTGEEIGRVADISTEGLMIASPTKHPLQERSILTFALPENCQEFASNLHGVEFEAQARWHRDDANQKYELTGYKVISPSDNYKLLCQSLIRQIGFKDY